MTRRLQIEDLVVTEISELSAVLDKNLDKAKIDKRFGKRKVFRIFKRKSMRGVLNRRVK